MENQNVLKAGTSLQMGESGNVIDASMVKGGVVENEVFGIELHAGVNFGGFVAGTINRKNAHGIVLTQEFNGIRLKGPKCNKLIPWAAMKGVDYLNDDGSEPVAGKSRI